jgi:trimeric autotransporter adhesin
VRSSCDSSSQRSCGQLISDQIRSAYLLPRIFAAITLLLVSLANHAATVEYFYDDLGRLVQAIRSDGSVQQYQYDASGNVVAINRVGTTAVSIASLSPPIGHVGATVTIAGTGFSPIASENAVIFAGSATAVVVAASPTSLTVTVPAGAVTGPITVTTNGVSGTSPMSYVVRKPTIASFSPLGVSPGGTVTLLGSNLNLVPGGTTVHVGGVAATITSISNTQVMFKPGTGSVHSAVVLTTPYGTATSSLTLVIAPSGISGNDIASLGALPPGGAGPTLSVAEPNKVAAYTFHATEGQYLTVQVTSLSTTPPGALLRYTLYSPTNAVLASPGNGSVSGTEKSLHLPRIPATGTYLIVFGSATATSFQLTATLEVNEQLEINGTATSVATAIAGQSKRFLFSAAAGQSFGFAITGVTMVPSPGTVAFGIGLPGGASGSYTGGECYTYKVPGCSRSFLAAPQGGLYTLLVRPVWQATMSFNLTLSPSVLASLTPDVAHSVDFEAAGQPARLTFSASAGQTFALNVRAIATVPAGLQTSVTVYGAAGNVAAGGNLAAEGTFNLRALAAGTYSVLIGLADAATGSLQVELASGLTGVLATDGTSSTFQSSVIGQHGYFTFSGTAGQSLGLAITSIATSPSAGTLGVAVYLPNGSYWNGLECPSTHTPGCPRSMGSLPVTGTYTMVVSPTTLRSMSFTLTLSEHLVGTLIPNVQQSLNLTLPGQHASLAFSAPGGQALSLNATSIATTPAGRRVYLHVLNASNVQVGTANGTGTVVVSLPGLAAGSYRVLIYAGDAATATMELMLQ